MTKRKGEDDDEKAKQVRFVMLSMIGPEIETRGYLSPRRRGTKKNWVAMGTVDGNRIRKSTSTTDWSEALKKCVAWTKALLEGRGIDDNPQVYNFHAVAGSYKEECSQEQGKNVDALLKWIPKHTLANAVTNKFLKDLCKKRWPKGISNATAQRQVFGVAKAIRNHGAENDMCSLPAYSTLRIAKDPIFWLRPDEFQKLVAAAAPDLEDLLIVMVASGPRPGEGLRARADDWAYGQLKLTQTKTHGTIRIMTMYPKAAAVLDRLAKEARANPRGGATYLFRTINGVPLPESPDAAKNVINDALNSLSKAVGLTDYITLKDLRSTWATWHGIVFRDIQETQKVGGWSTITTVADYYSEFASRELRNPILRIWGIDPGDIDRWRLRPPSDREK